MFRIWLKTVSFQCGWRTMTFDANYTQICHHLTGRSVKSSFGFSSSRHSRNRTDLLTCICTTFHIAEHAELTSNTNSKHEFEFNCYIYKHWATVRWCVMRLIWWLCRSTHGACGCCVYAVYLDGSVRREPGLIGDDVEQLQLVVGVTIKKTVVDDDYLLVWVADPGRYAVAGRVAFGRTSLVGCL